MGCAKRAKALGEGERWDEFPVNLVRRCQSAVASGCIVDKGGTLRCLVGPLC